MTLSPDPDTPPIALRPPAQVMRLERMGSFHQSRLSFMRILLRRVVAEGWRFERSMFDIDKNGVGTALYAAHGPSRSYTLVAFAHDLPDDLRSDRVIAEAWDATFTLFDGIPTAEDVQRLAQNVPLQEAGRISETELSLARANRSVRLFDHVVSRLAAGQQPDHELIESVGYLMRTTAVYGSGKFGAADREIIADRPEAQAPFQIEMLTVYLIRTFVLDLVEHLAQLRNPAKAVPMDPALRRRLGIGNSTGLGMAPFLINHPVLLNNWVAAREEALLRVRNVGTAKPAAVAVFTDRLARAIQNAAIWRSVHALQQEKLTALRRDLDRLHQHLKTTQLAAAYPWNALYQWAEVHLDLEAQEQLVSLLLEPYPDLVDGLSTCMAADETAFTRIDGTMTLRDLAETGAEFYSWARDIDWTARAAQARAWYVSAEKLEPRLGERFEEPIAAYEQPLAPGRDGAALLRDLDAWDGKTLVATFLLKHPEHRHMVQRLQILNRCPYGEIRDNTISASVLPIDMLRCKLSFFGAGHFDPRSDRWVRINMFQGAPFPHELAAQTPDDWSYPAPPA